jgi:hypothetical protein
MSENVALVELNAVTYLYLQQLTEPRDNSLRLVAQEAVVNRSDQVRSELPDSTKSFSTYLPIESTERCRTFELYWKHYAAYLVTEEMVGSIGRHDDEVFRGKLLRVYSKSHFLDHLARDTGGHPEPIQHYKLICLNHLIDVAAYAPPEIRVITGAPQSLRPR